MLGWIGRADGARIWFAIHVAHRARHRRPRAKRHRRWIAALPLRWRFYGSGLYISPLAPLLLGFVSAC
jgi:hypothetical protein